MYEKAPIGSEDPAGTEWWATYGLAVVLASAGLFSGLVTAGLTYPVGEIGSYYIHKFHAGFDPYDPQLVLRGVFGVVIAVSLAISGVMKSWKAPCLPVAAAAAYFVSIISAGSVEILLPVLGGKQWLMGTPFSVSPVSLFVGGFLGGLVVIATVLLLTFPRAGIGTLARMILWGALASGALGAIGWPLGSTLGMGIWWGLSSLGLTGNASDETSAGMSLDVVWQAGMGFVLGAILQRAKAIAESRTLSPRS